MTEASSWCGHIAADRVYLPAGDDTQMLDSKGVPLDEEIVNYIVREFPLPTDDESQSLCYSVPKIFVQHGEAQACEAELISHRRICNLKLPTDEDGSLWTVCFQGVSYAGRSFRNTRDGKYMTREHDLVVFNRRNDKYFVSLVEVKSTCDIPAMQYVQSDSVSIKNNKRSGQHQLRDHIEILKNILNITEDDLNSFLFWPFLSGYTYDPRGSKVRRWEKESNHVFTDILSDQGQFDRWFHRAILNGRSISKVHFDALFKRFIVLSCGVFVNEIHEGMLALLSQQQATLFHKKPNDDGRPTVVHGAAGTGKTLMVLHKLVYLHEQGLLNNKNRALYICYWQGIRREFRRKLEKLKISEFVDTVIFCISRDDFLEYNRLKYRHIFMDECEAICLAFNEKIIENTFGSIDRCRLTDYDENFNNLQRNIYKSPTATADNKNAEAKRTYGELWYLVDINQATIFIPKYSPEILKTPNVTLSKVLRNTGTIYRVFSEFYKSLPVTKTLIQPASPTANISHYYLSNIKIGHNINGPPIYWVNSSKFSDTPMPSEVLSNSTFNGLIHVIMDLYSTKGIKPRDMCVIPFFVTELFLPGNINTAISSCFVTNGFQPVATTDVEDYVCTKDTNKFLVPWVLRTKGLEFKVVVIVIEDDEDFNSWDTEDRRRVYIMASRCTCLLILVSNESVKDTIDINKVIKAYPFNENF